MAKKIIKEVDAHVGALVRQRRMALGMSQEKLSHALGLTFQQVQKYEKATNRIGSSRLMQIANALQVSPSFFFEGAPSAARIAPSKQAPAQYVAEFVASKDGEKLIKAFIRMPRAIQRSIVDMVEKVADNES